MFLLLPKKPTIVIVMALLACNVISPDHNASGLTLQEAYDQALENYETVKIALESLTQAELQKKKALSALFRHSKVNSIISDGRRRF